MTRSDRIRHFVASGFYLGLLPLVPGSFGALVGLAWHAVAYTIGCSDSLMRLWCLWGVVLFSLAHYRLTPWAQRYWGDSDPKNFVLDEIVGYLCVPLFAVPLTAWWQVPLGFCIFRILDAIKLPVARYIDRNVHSAHGVLFDDVVSAAYTALILSGIVYLCD